MNLPFLDEKKRFYCSYEYLDALITSASECSLSYFFLKDHVISGLANYTVEEVGSDDLAAVAQFRHHDLMTLVMRNDLSVPALARLVKAHRASLSNVVPHKPIHEFFSPRSASDRPSDLLRLHDLSELTRQNNSSGGWSYDVGNWIDDLKQVYRASPLLSAGWSSMVSLSFDCMMLAGIQARASLRGFTSSSGEELFGHRRASSYIPDRTALMDSLFNSLSALKSFGVLRQPLPDRKDWEHLLAYPEAALRCNPEGVFAPLPGPDALKDIALRSGQAIPKHIFISPDPDTLARYLRSPDFSSPWSLLSSAGPNTQAVIVKNRHRQRSYAVFVLHARKSVVYFAGNLEPSLLNFWGDALYAMTTDGTKKIAQLEDLENSFPVGS